MSNGAAIAAAHYAMESNALKACGSIISLDETEFERLLEKTAKPTVVLAVGRGMNPARKYLTSYRGLTFYCKTKKDVLIPKDAEVVRAKKMSIPDIWDIGRRIPVRTDWPRQKCR